LSSFAQAQLIPPHFDLDMTSSEYQTYLANLPRTTKSTEPGIDYAIKMGERLSKWIALVNARRAPENAIRLTSATTRRSSPIETPNIYSPTIIQKDMDKVSGDLPEAIKKVILADTALPNDLGIDDETFIKHGRLLDRIYQSAARYKSLNGYRYYYIQAAARDVRGYYYLTKNKITANELRDVAIISADKVQPIKNALTQLCQNAGQDLKKCQAEIDQAFSSNSVSQTYTTYYPAGQKLWNDFFQIPADGKRNDITWTDAVMTVPFNTPSIPKFQPYLQNNIQDEYRFGTWALKMNFGTYQNGPRLIFEAGVVPHVNGLGGNEIVMDSNQPIEEYESQWTIRHEFGHVLGLPDCYHEFYDTNLEAYVNYQLDVTDLMCSRAGNMKERIYKELKRVYQ
jgi:hypothetical protein